MFLTWNCIKLSNNPNIYKEQKYYHADKRMFSRILKPSGNTFATCAYDFGNHAAESV